MTVNLTGFFLVPLCEPSQNGGVFVPPQEHQSYLPGYRTRT